MDHHWRLDLARTHAEDLRRDAARAAGRNRPRRLDATAHEASIVIRPDRPEDQPALARLAGLDSAKVPPAPLLLAEVGGRLQAAMSLSNGATIADPFYRTASLVTLLTTRARQLDVEPAGGRGVLTRLRRLAPRARRSSLPAR